MSGVTLKMVEGLPFEYVITLRDSEGTEMDIAGSEIVMKIRRAVQDPNVLVELSTANGRITFTGEVGQFKIEIEPEVTGTLSGTFVFDILLITAGGEYYLIAEGSRIKTSVFVSRGGITVV